jgi:hypothetical protein
MADGTEGKRFYRTLPWWQVSPGGAPGEWVDARGNPVASTPAGPSRTTFSTPPVVRRGTGPSSVAVANPAKYGADPFTATTSPVPAWMRGDGLTASAKSKVRGPRGYTYTKLRREYSPNSDPRMSIGVDEPPGFDSAMLGRLASLTNAGELRQSAEDALFSELARQPTSPWRGLSRATSPPPKISAIVGQQSPPMTGVSRPAVGTQTSMPASMPEGYRVPIVDKPSTSPTGTTNPPAKPPSQAIIDPAKYGTDRSTATATPAPDWIRRQDREMNIAEAEEFLRNAGGYGYDFRSPSTSQMPPLPTNADTYSQDELRVKPHYEPGMREVLYRQRERLKQYGKSDDLLALQELMRTYRPDKLATAYSMIHGGTTKGSLPEWRTSPYGPPGIQEDDYWYDKKDPITNELEHESTDRKVGLWQRHFGKLSWNDEISVPAIDDPRRQQRVEFERRRSDDPSKSFAYYQAAYDATRKPVAVFSSHPYSQRNSMHAHELYHADQHRRFLFPHMQMESYRATDDPRQRLMEELGVEFAPSIISTIVPIHARLDYGASINQDQFATPREADAQVQAYLERRTDGLPRGYIAGPSGAAIPYTWAEQQAARYGAFGPTARAKKLGFQGKERIPIEQLLNSDIGRSWFNHYMTSRPASQ